MLVSNSSVLWRPRRTCKTCLLLERHYAHVLSRGDDSIAQNRRVGAVGEICSQCILLGKGVLVVKDADAASQVP